MASVSETTASLRIMGDDLDPVAVTTLLGGEPSETYRKGDVIHGAAGQTRIAKFGAWRRVARRRLPGDLDDQVRELFAGLTEDVEIWRNLTARYKVDVFCGLFLTESNEGIDLSAETMWLLGARGIVIGFDIYGP